MHFQLSYPSEEQLRNYLAKQEHDDFSYPELYATKNKKTLGYDNDHNQILLGQGEMVWEKAKQAFINWDQYPKPWTDIFPKRAPLKEGQTVVVLFRVMGLWWINSARIIYTIDEPNCFGWAYGTLNDHVEKGEECFWIEKNAKGEITYHIRAFSRPSYWMAKMAYPLARFWQKQFVKESMVYMQNMTQENDTLLYVK